MNRLLSLFALLPLILNAQQADLIVEKSIQRIAFGSCSRQDLPNHQLWKEVNEVKPDLWIWLGDNIYGDTEDMDVMREKYNQQKSHSDYQKLLSQTDVIGIWDDHDFGANDVGKDYPKKDKSKTELFAFLDVPQNHPARDRKGAYQSYTYKGRQLSIKVILLDARYFRDSLVWANANTAQKAAIRNTVGDILGEEQWTWLQSQLQDDSVELILLGSGIQVLPTQHRWEKWSNFPTARKRLLSLIDRSVKKPVILLSGDRHISETSKTKLDRYPYPLWEFTSSSLTSPITNQEPEANDYRQKEIIYPRNFAVLQVDRQKQKLVCNIKFLGAENKMLQDHSVTFRMK